MRPYQTKFLAALVSLLFISSCKKDKRVIGETPDQPKIVLIKDAADNSDWQLNVDAAGGNRSGIWVDLNNNGQKDNGEVPTNFGMDLFDRNDFPLGSSRTIAVYGQLAKLGCTSNSLTSINLSGNTGLEELDCSYNILSGLDVKMQLGLKSLSCSYNELTTLDLSMNTALTSLDCYANQLTTLDLTKNKALKTLLCFSNKMTTLDLSQNTNVETLTCFINKLPDLNLSANVSLRRVDVSRNLLTGTTMQQFLSNLPTCPVNDKGTLYLLYPPETNSRPTPSEVTAARAKNWLIYEMKPTGWTEM